MKTVQFHEVPFTKVEIQEILINAALGRIDPKPVEGGYVSKVDNSWPPTVIFDDSRNAVVYIKERASGEVG